MGGYSDRTRASKVCQLLVEPESNTQCWRMCPQIYRCRYIGYESALGVRGNVFLVLLLAYWGPLELLHQLPALVRERGTLTAAISIELVFETSPFNVHIVHCCFFTLYVYLTAQLYSVRPPIRRSAWLRTSHHSMTVFFTRLLLAPPVYYNYYWSALVTTINICISCP